MMMDVKGTAGRIHTLRINKGYSQAKVARDIGISLSAYKKIEQGQNSCSMDTFIALEMYFDTNLDYLLHGRIIAKNQ